MSNDERFMAYMRERKSSNYPKCKANCCLIKLCDAPLVRALCCIVNGAFEEWQQREGKDA